MTGRVATAPPAPALAQAVFGERVTVAQRYADLLAGAGTERGLLGPREVPRIWERHLLNCAAPAPLVPDAAQVVDLGSGAGLPGVVLAILRPDLEVTLVEPMLRRVTFLEEVLADLGLEQVRVVRARAEELSGHLRVDVVTARALTALRRLVTLAAPLLRPGGTLLALKGSSAAQEIADAAPVLRRHRAVAEALAVGDDLAWPRATVVRVRFPAEAGLTPGGAR